MNEIISIPQRDHEHERVLGVIFNISPAQASALSCLCRGTIVTGDEILEYTGSKSPAKVIVNRTRAALKAFDMDIKTKWGVGYWMEPDDKDRIAVIVNKFLTGA